MKCDSSLKLNIFVLLVSIDFYYYYFDKIQRFGQRATESLPGLVWTSRKAPAATFVFLASVSFTQLRIKTSGWGWGGDGDAMAVRESRACHLQQHDMEEEKEVDVEQ